MTREGEARSGVLARTSARTIYSRRRECHLFYSFTTVHSPISCDSHFPYRTQVTTICVLQLRENNTTTPHIDQTGTYFTPDIMATVGEDTFTLLPLHIDPQTKAVSSSDASLLNDLEQLNHLARAFTQLETPNQVTPPPAPVNPKRSVQITKLKDSGNAAYKKGSFSDAIKMYDLAIKMAADRPPWEASGLAREELSLLHGNRSQALYAQQDWAAAAVDAEIAVELKRIGNVKAWWRRAQCLKEMGRIEEALEFAKTGLEFERAGPEKAAVGELEALTRELQASLKK